jgi:hypothetical protein
MKAILRERRVYSSEEDTLEAIRDLSDYHLSAVLPTAITDREVAGSIPGIYIILKVD